MLFLKVLQLSFLSMHLNITNIKAWLFFSKNQGMGKERKKKDRPTMVGFFEVLSCVQYKESFYISFNSLWKKNPNTNDCTSITDSSIAMLICIKDERQHTYHLTRQWALGGKSLFMHSKSCIGRGRASVKKLIHKKSISIHSAYNLLMLVICWIQGILKAEISDHTHQIPEIFTQKQINALWIPHSETVFCHILMDM